MTKSAVKMRVQEPIDKQDLLMYIFAKNVLERLNELEKSGELDKEVKNDSH